MRRRTLRQRWRMRPGIGIKDFALAWERARAFYAPPPSASALRPAGLLQWQRIRSQLTTSGVWMSRDQRVRGVRHSYRWRQGRPILGRKFLFNDALQPYPQQWGICRMGTRIKWVNYTGQGIDLTATPAYRWQWKLRSGASRVRLQPTVWFLGFPAGGTLVVPNAIVGPDWQYLNLPRTGRFWHFWERWDVLVSLPALPPDIQHRLARSTCTPSVAGLAGRLSVVSPPVPTDTTCLDESAPRGLPAPP